MAQNQQQPPQQQPQQQPQAAEQQLHQLTAAGLVSPQQAEQMKASPQGLGFWIKLVQGVLGVVLGSLGNAGGNSGVPESAPKK